MYGAIMRALKAANAVLFWVLIAEGVLGLTVLLFIVR